MTTPGEDPHIYRGHHKQVSGTRPDNEVLSRLSNNKAQFISLKQESRYVVHIACRVDCDHVLLKNYFLLGIFVFFAVQISSNPLIRIHFLKSKIT